MGYELRRQLREALGPDITGLQRAVALEIADDAKDETRISMAPLSDLVRWTGAKDASVVRNALKRLAASGWEFRMPIGKGGDGRVLYAVPGRRMTYKVPHFEGVATATPSPSEGGAGAHSEGATATPSTFKGEQGLPLGGAGATPSGTGSQGSDSAGQPGNQRTRGASQGGAGATPSRQQGGATATPLPSKREEEEEETSSSQGRATATPSEERDYHWQTFGAFWTCYPRSKDIEKTRAAWREALDAGANPQQIAAAATAYAHERAGEDPRFTKHSANWLRERRYEDDYTPAPQPGSRPALRALNGGQQRPTHEEINNMTDEEVADALRF